MKIVNIFGLVVAVHVVVLLLIFAIPGCRTSAKPTETEMVSAPPAQSMGSQPSPIQPAPSMSAADLNPPLAPAGSINSTAVPTVSGPIGNGGRFSPTRPGGATSSAPASSAAAPTANRTYTVVRGDSLWSIAKRHGVSVRELAAANNLTSNAVLKLDQSLQIPASAGTSPTGSAATSSAATSSAGAANAASGSGSYVIRPGDTLGAIAKRHGTTVSALKSMNNLRSDMVRVGDTLVIPEAAESSAPATPRPAAPAATAPATASDAGASLARGANGSMKHVVAPGETLGAIARKYNVRLGDLALANNIADPTRIRPGQELVVPGQQSTAARPQVPTQYPPSFQAETPAPTEEPPTIRTEPPADDVPVIQVEEPTQTLTVEPAPGGGGGGSQPPLFN